MSADFKSHVLRRDEKGFFGVPFKRWLLAGCGGGLTYTLVNMVAASWAIPIAAIVTVAFVVMTGQRGGLPLWQRLIYHLRGRLILAAAKQPQSVAATLAQTLDLPTEAAVIHGAVIFAPPPQSGAVDLRDWIIYAGTAEADGLTFVTAPFEDTP
jgi:hypothetical protein